MSPTTTPGYRVSIAGWVYDALNAVIWLPTGSDALRRSLVAELEIQPDQRVLELGCGTGLVTRHLIDAGADVTAVDRAQTMLERARRRAPQARFVEGDAQAEVTGPFDAIVLSFVLHELTRLERIDVLSHARTLLSPAGAIGVLEWSQPERPIRRRLWHGFVRAIEPAAALEVLEGGIRQDAQAAAPRNRPHCLRGGRPGPDIDPPTRSLTTPGAHAMSTALQTAPLQWRHAPTTWLDTGTVQFAYRVIGNTPSEPPLVLLHRFRGTIDDWDPALLDRLAEHRQVIVFDNSGVGRSTGAVPSTIQGMADGAVQFIRSLGLNQVDLLGWSMGGAVAQQIALEHPELVRRLVLAGTGPGGVAEAPRAPAHVWEVAPKLVNDDEDFLYLFFPEHEDGRAAGIAHLARLGQRDEDRGPAVSLEGVTAQAIAIFEWAKGEGSSLPRLGEITIPVLVANGVDDVMIHAHNSYVMAQRLPNAELILYRRAGHGFLFQHPERFARAVTEFLA